MLARIWTEVDCLIHPEHFGFRREHSTTLQLMRVLTQLSDARNWQLFKGAVLLDVSKAFDKAWQEELLFKLPQTPALIVVVFFLRSYLRDRIFRVRVDEALYCTSCTRMTCQYSPESRYMIPRA